MIFDLTSLILSPYFLIFVTLCIGMVLGDWKKMGSFQLGVGGPLFIGLGVGWAVYSYAQSVPESDPGYSAAASLISNNVIPGTMQNLMLVLFIAAIGLLASKDLRFVMKKNGLKFIILGIIVTAFGAGASYLSTFVANINAYEASGVYTGALTSSPGLGAALESSAKHASDLADKYETLSSDEQAELLLRIDPTGALTPENTPSLTDKQKETLSVAASANVGTAYAVAYPFGMLSVILGVMIIPKIFSINVKKELEEHQSQMRQMREMSGAKEAPTVPFSILSYSFVCFTGLILGAVEIKMGSMGTFSLGTSGGVLIMAVICGYFGKIGPMNFRMDGAQTGVLRDITLGSYLGMIGLSYGYRVVQAVAGSGIAFAAASLIIGVLSVIVGFIVGHYLFKINWILLSGAICGGMTSTPGLGVACNTVGSDDPGAGYAAAYPSALLGMVLFSIIMYSL